MAIKLTDNSIRIGNYILSEVSDGINFTGVLKADKFQGTGFQGTVAGFSAGGFISSPPAVFSNVIDKFPFATDTNATDHGDTIANGCCGAGHSSVSHGFTSASGPTFSNVIQKYPFSTASNATDVGDLTQTRTNPAGNSSDVSGYACGGYAPGAEVTTIDKFSFSTNTNATDVGDLLTDRGQLDGQGENSTTHGYVSGGTGPVNVIQKFPFATDTNATDVGDLTQGRAVAAGCSSLTHGYVAGGSSSPTYWPGFSNVIDRFPFSANSNATDVGDLTAQKNSFGSQSSTNFGYVSGGQTLPGPPGIRINVIEKFPFSSSANGSDVGDLTQARAYAPGSQD